MRGAGGWRFRTVICERSEAIQDPLRGKTLDCFAVLAMTEYEVTASLLQFAF
jgi:hypothetical protein